MLGLVPFRKNGATNSGVLATSRIPWEFDRMIDRFFDDAWRHEGPAIAGDIRLEIVDKDETIVIRAEIPGIDVDDLDLQLTSEMLTLSGEKRDEAGSENDRHYSERVFGSFQRQVQLPCPVDVERVDAKYDRGILNVTLWKSEAVRPRRISVDKS